MVVDDDTYSSEDFHDNRHNGLVNALEAPIRMEQVNVLTDALGDAPIDNDMGIEFSTHIERPPSLQEALDAMTKRHRTLFWRSLAKGHARLEPFILKLKIQNIARESFQKTILFIVVAS